jgi:chemotaxis protein CheX
MSTLQDVHVTGDVLWSIVAEVWESILEQPAARADHAFNLDDALTAAVTISGDWDGVVTFTCPQPAAVAIARAMLALGPDDEVSDEDVADALGEVVNVVGGQVKSLCPGDNHLGLPLVSHGMVLPHAQPCCRTGVEWAGHVARVAVWRSTATAVGSGEGEAR